MPNPYGKSSYGGNIGVNDYGKLEYQGPYDPINKGTLYYKGIWRYGIAVAPAIQNPYLAVNSFEETGINAMDMIYGTCADAEITINEKKYFIPTIVVDVKSYSYPLETFQTGREFQTGNLDLNYDDGSLNQKGILLSFM